MESIKVGGYEVEAKVNDDGGIEVTILLPEDKQRKKLNDCHPITIEDAGSKVSIILGPIKGAW